MSRKKLATVWLDGCSGCHMSFLDMDERLIELADKVDLVYSPLVDTKQFPQEVDIALVEGAVSSDEDLDKIQMIRRHTKTLVSFGDCAVTANVPAMRNPFTVQSIYDRAYRETAAREPGTPDQCIPRLLAHARPVHEVVSVDLYIPGCPPSADVIYYALTELLEGRQPELSSRTRFGA